jgi:hypothetical protein
MPIPKPSICGGPNAQLRRIGMAVYEDFATDRKTEILFLRSLQDIDVSIQNATDALKLTALAATPWKPPCKCGVVRAISKGEF